MNPLIRLMLIITIVPITLLWVHHTRAEDIPKKNQKNTIYDGQKLGIRTGTGILNGKLLISNGLYYYSSQWDADLLYNLSKSSDNTRWVHQAYVLFNIYLGNYFGFTTGHFFEYYYIGRETSYQTKISNGLVLGFIIRFNQSFKLAFNFTFNVIPFYQNARYGSMYFDRFVYDTDHIFLGHYSIFFEWLIHDHIILQTRLDFTFITMTLSFGLTMSYYFNLGKD